MKTKLLTSIIAALALSACGSTQPEFTAEKDVTFKPDLEKHSLAYNIALSSGAPNAIKDAEVPQEAYDRISGASHTASFVNGFMIGGLGASLSFGWQSLLMDRMNGFDGVNVTLWIPVDSLADYGNDDFKLDIYKKVTERVKTNFVQELDLNEKPTYYNGGSILKFNGKSCANYIEFNAIPDEFENINDCVISLPISIVRPIDSNAWMPEYIERKSANHVLVRIESQSRSHTMLDKLYPEGFAYYPPEFIYRFSANGKTKSLKVKKGYPYYQYKNKQFLFVKPKKNG